MFNFLGEYKKEDFLKFKTFIIKQQTFIEDQKNHNDAEVKRLQIYLKKIYGSSKKFREDKNEPFIKDESTKEEWFEKKSPERNLVGRLFDVDVATVTQNSKKYFYENIKHQRDNLEWKIFKINDKIESLEIQNELRKRITEKNITEKIFKDIEKKIADPEFYRNFKEFNRPQKKLSEAQKKVFETSPSGLSSFSNLGGVLPESANKIISAASEAIAFFNSTVETVNDTIDDAKEDASSIISEAVSSITNSISNFFNF